MSDGFFVLLKPLPPGTHTITFGGTTPGGSLGPLSIDVTYTINVVPKGQFKAQAAPVAASGRVARHNVFGDAGRIAEQVL